MCGWAATRKGKQSSVHVDNNYVRDVFVVEGNEFVEALIETGDEVVKKG